MQSWYICWQFSGILCNDIYKKEKDRIVEVSVTFKPITYSIIS